MVKFMSKADVKFYKENLEDLKRDLRGSKYDTIVTSLVEEQYNFESIDHIMKSMGFYVDKENDIFCCEQGAVIEPICLQTGQTLKNYLRENKHKLRRYHESGLEISIGRSILTSVTQYRGGYSYRLYSDYSLCCSNYQYFLDKPKKRGCK